MILLSSFCLLPFCCQKGGNEQFALTSSGPGCLFEFLKNGLFREIDGEQKGREMVLQVHKKVHYSGSKYYFKKLPAGEIGQKKEGLWRPPFSFQNPVPN